MNVLNYTPKQINSYKQETGYGLDLNNAWLNQKQAIKESGTRLINELLQKEPERVLPYILETNTKGSRKNTQVSRLVKVLKEKGTGELNGLRKSFAGYIQDNFIEENLFNDIVMSYMMPNKEQDGNYHDMHYMSE